MAASTVNPQSNFSEINQDMHIPPEWFQHYNDIMDIVLRVIHVCVIVISCFTLLTLACARRLQTTSNMVLASLAVADLLVGLVMILDIYVLDDTSLPTGDVSWVSRTFVYTALPQFPMIASQMHTVIMAGDKYLAVMYPLRYEGMWTPIRVRWVLLGAWLWGAIWEEPSQDGMPTIHSLLTAITTFLLEIVAVTALYSRILQVARKQRQRIRDETTENDKAGSSWRVTKTPRGSRLLSLTIVIIFLCWGPFFAITIVMHFIELKLWHYALQYSLLAFAFSHYLVNFAMLLWKSKEFRIAYKQMLLLRFKELQS